MFQDYQSSAYSQDDIRRSVLASYTWMAIGLLITGLVSFGLYSSGFFLVMLERMPILPIILFFAQIILVVLFSRSVVRTSSAGAMKVLFILYALTLGITLTSIFYTYTTGIIGVAFLVAAVYFLCLAIIGTTTKKDMTRFGSICMAGLFALIISQGVLALLGIGMDTRLYSLVGLLLFTGLTVWDVQRMNRMLVMDDGSLIPREKIAIYFALELYLDFINIFLYILQLLGAGSSSRD